MDSETRGKLIAMQGRIEAERVKRGLSARPAARPVAAAVHRIAPAEPAPTNAFYDVLANIPEYTAEDEARWAAEDASKAQREKHEKDEARWAMIRRFKLPITEADEQRLFNRTVEDRGMVQAVRRWEASDKPWIMLAGTVGRGKTIAAADALVRRERGRYVAARELERVFAARYGAEVEQQEAICNIPFLVIDDIGRERDADGMKDALLEVVDRRRGRMRTIAITNMHKAAFVERYADVRLHSRLDESAAWYAEKGDDMRRGR
jgi:DNA replication protein DnaC